MKIKKSTLRSLFVKILVILVVLAMILTGFLVMFK